MPPAASGRAVARVRIRADARELRNLRERLREVFDRHEVESPLSDDLLLVANELTTNAIEASALGTDVTVEVRVGSSHVTMTVENVGPPFAIPDSLMLPPGSHLRGRGLALSRSLVGDLSAQRTTDGTRVVARCARG